MFILFLFCNEVQNEVNLTNDSGNDGSYYRDLVISVLIQHIYTAL